MLEEKGAYLVTAGTYHKEHFFNTAKKLDLLEGLLLDLCLKYGLLPQAWAVFSNHYHLLFVTKKDSQCIRDYVRHLHSLTAREVNRIDSATGRKVWFQYWDTVLSDQKTYFARMNYVLQNPVMHGLVERAASYPWCSATWFETRARPALVKTVYSFPTDRQKVIDSYEPKMPR